MFNINDNVVYGSQGVCTIVEITEKPFLNQKLKYYVLRPAYQKDSKVFVPVDNEKLTQKMRRVLSATEIKELLSQLPDEDTLWIENENERKQKFQEILKEGDRTKLVMLIKALSLHQQEQKDKGKKLHNCDEIFLKEAEKLLYNEFALVLQIEPCQVLPFILEQINQNEINQNESNK